MTPEQVAESWASWVTSDILDALEDQDIIDVEDERFAEVLIATLKDIAIANATAPQTTSEGLSKEQGT